MCQVLHRFNLGNEIIPSISFIGIGNLPERSPLIGAWEALPIRKVQLFYLQTIKHFASHFNYTIFGFYTCSPETEKRENWNFAIYLKEAPDRGKGSSSGWKSAIFSSALNCTRILGLSGLGNGTL